MRSKPDKKHRYRVQTDRGIRWLTEEEKDSLLEAVFKPITKQDRIAYIAVPYGYAEYEDGILNGATNDFLKDPVPVAFNRNTGQVIPYDENGRWFTGVTEVRKFIERMSPTSRPHWRVTRRRLTKFNPV